MATLYGIRSCGTVRKARAWLDGHGIDYAFHDYKQVGLDELLARGWIAELGWEVLINRRGTTWRTLPQTVRDGIDAESAVRLMVEHPSVLRRPLLDTGCALHLGFSESQYVGIFG